MKSLQSDRVVTKKCGSRAIRSIVASKVATLTVTDFGGSIDVNTKVDNLTVEDAYALDIADATDLESLTVQGVQAFGKAYDALSATSKLAYGYDSARQDVDVPAGADDLSTVTLTGKFNVVDLGNGLANLATVTMNADATSLDLSVKVVRYVTHINGFFPSQMAFFST